MPGSRLGSFARAVVQRRLFSAFPPSPKRRRSVFRAPETSLALDPRPDALGVSPHILDLTFLIVYCSELWQIMNLNDCRREMAPTLYPCKSARNAVSQQP